MRVASRAHSAAGAAPLRPREWRSRYITVKFDTTAMSTLTHPHDRSETPPAFVGPAVVGRGVRKLVAGAALASFLAGVLAPRLFDVHTDLSVAAALILWAATPGILFLVGRAVLGEWRRRKAGPLA